MTSLLTHAGPMMAGMIAFWVLLIVVHVSFAFAVLRDAGSLPENRKPIFVGSAVWFLGTLLGGVFAAAAYWTMHHSRLNAAIPVAHTVGP